MIIYQFWLSLNTGNFGEGGADITIWKVLSPVFATFNVGGRNVIR